MAIEWTEERVAALETPQIKNLRENALKRDVAALAELCSAELAKRNADKPRRIGQPRSEAKQFEHDMADQIAAVGKTLAEKYDLSEATAKAKSEGVKGFKAHKLLDSKGSAKLGGMQRDGSVAVDRYISYRRGKDIVTLSVFLLKDQPLESHEFQVIAPLTMLDGGKPVAEIRPTATPAQKQSADGGLSFKDLDSAAAAFDAVLAKIAA
ncbi:hypothetical protein RPMA_12810 [Tardiphaga alba]|uniref:Uncharacterized protein n=1 Tax=Tardiphaga alba TaxID=340268 RepID=A0ABX8A7J8_9BRAD|nr:hypothetical protein [Tardiphaga alba]QUS39624.1 hypothetical protein RPMA_12810 [Tardiphaga alba]